MSDPSSPPAQGSRPPGPTGLGAYYRSERAELYAFARRSGLGPCPRVLNVGCAAGADEQQLRTLGAQVICGIEPNPAAAAEARCAYDRVFQGTFDDFVWDGERYDLIVFADSLEHMQEPGEALARVKSWVSVGGALLISIPNVRHASVTWEILRGDFRYRDAGILDRTHLRFFTSRSFLRLLRGSGWRCCALKRWGAMPLARWVARALPGSGEFVQSQVFIVARSEEGSPEPLAWWTFWADRRIIGDAEAHPDPRTAQALTQLAM